MKGVIQILTIVLLLGCNQSKTKTHVQNVSETVVETITEEKDTSSNYLRRVEVTNGIFTTEDLTSDFCLVFGIGEGYSNSDWENMNLDSLKGFIVDPTYKESINLKELRAQRIHIHPNNDSLPICKFGNSILIPFSSSEDRIHLTKWNVVSTDSIVFDKLVQPSILRKNSGIVSVKSIELKDQNYLSIYMQGGEGGANWDELLIVKVDKNDRYETIEKEVVGYCHDCGDLARISLKINQDGFTMIEVRDSMKFVNDKWEREWRKEKILKKVKI